MDARLARPVIRITSVIGIVLFAAVLAVTFVAPDKIESAARDFIATEIRAEVEERFGSGTMEKAGQAAGKLRDKFIQKSKRLRTALQAGAAERVAAIVARLCRYDCVQRKALAGTITAIVESRITRLGVGAENLESIAKGRYAAILAKIFRDLRIFSGSNVAIFMAIFAVTFMPRLLVRMIALPTVLMVVATFLASAFYLFEQNWFFTILFNSYMGYGYLGYVAFIALLLFDIVFLEARITRAIMDAIGRAISSCGFPIGV